MPVAVLFTHSIILLLTAAQLLFVLMRFSAGLTQEQLDFIDSGCWRRRWFSPKCFPQLPRAVGSQTAGA